MRTCLAVLLAASATCFAGEKAHFFGTWEPRPALRDFWRPVRDSWWQTGVGTKSPLVARHCEDFARHHTPETAIPEMIADLKAYQSEVHWFVYLYIVKQWPEKRVLHILAPFERSKDEEIHHIASEFIADVESPE